MKETSPPHLGHGACGIWWRWPNSYLHA